MPLGWYTKVTLLSTFSLSPTPVPQRPTLLSPACYTTSPLSLSPTFSLLSLSLSLVPFNWKSLRLDSTIQPPSVLRKSEDSEWWWWWWVQEEEYPESERGGLFYSPQWIWWEIEALPLWEELKYKGKFTLLPSRIAKLFCFFFFFIGDCSMDLYYRCTRVCPVPDGTTHTKLRANLCLY